MPLLSYIKLNILNLFRENFYDVHSGKLKAGKVFIYCYFCFSFYFALFNFSDFIANYINTSVINLKEYPGLLLFIFLIFFFAGTILKSVQIISDISSSDIKLKTFPVNTKYIILPNIINEILKSLSNGIIFLLPFYLMLLKLLQLSAEQQIINLFVLFLSYQLISLIIYYVLSKIILTFSNVKIETLLSVLIIGLMLAIMGLIILFMRNFNDTGYSIELILTTLNDLFLFPVVINILLYQEAIEFLLFLTVSFPLIILFINLLLSQFNKIISADRSDQKNIKAGILFNDLFPGYNTEPIIAYFKKELIGFLRKPHAIVTHLILFILANILIIKLFDFSKNATLFLCYNFPILLISKYYLHSVGQEGNYLYTIKLLNGFKKYFIAKYILGISVTIPISIIYCLVIDQAFNCCESYVELATLLLFIIVTCFFSVFFALCIGTSFMDYNVKRLYLDRGVTIGGEILFYFLSWIPGTSFVYFQLSIFTSTLRYFYIGGIILILFFCLSRLFYIKALRSINNIA